MFKIIVMFIFASAQLSFAGGLREKIEVLSLSCAPERTLTIKKILLAVHREGHTSGGGGCSENIRFLLKNCTKDLSCQELVNLIQKIESGESSNVIGE